VARSRREDGSGSVTSRPNLCLKVDVIVAINPAATFAAKRSTASIPIVMVNTPDPVQLGLVVSLGRPGGNVTGTTTLSADVSIKQLELLKDANRRLVESQ
jgi:ABC-type uncharacterized transport system substrate-binding protein